MILDESEISRIQTLASRFVEAIGEMGVDASVVLYSYQNDEGDYVLDRFGDGNPYAQDGMINRTADANSVRNMTLDFNPEDIDDGE